MLPFLRVPWFGNNTTVLDECHLRLWLAAPLRWDRNFPGDTKLGGEEIQGADDGLFVSLGTGVHHTPQPAPDQHITAGNHLCSRVDVPQDDHRTRM